MIAGLEAFKKEAVKPIENIKKKVSDRFPEFEYRALTAEDNNALMEECKKRVSTGGRKGSYREETDTNAYVKKLIVETVIFPPFKSKELQDDWGVIGAEQLIGKMLSAGEYATVMKHVQEINGFQTEEEQAEELDNLKN